MKENPLVSIIMPVYKVENYIENSIKSVMRQTYANIELILVNDGSPDASMKIAKKILSNGKINYQIIEQKNCGQGQARNSGIDIAHGSWICFLDSDDLFSNNAIEHLVRCGLEFDADLVFSSFKEIYAVKEMIEVCNVGKTMCFAANEIQERFLRRTSVVLAPGTLFRKQVLADNKLRFEKIPWSEDQHFVWKVLQQINKAVYLDEPLYQYLRHPGSIMDATKIDAMISSYFHINQLQGIYANNQFIAHYLVPRWVMGTLNSATIMTKYQDWKKLASKLEMSKNYTILLSFPEKKVKVFACLGMCSPFLYYYINRKRKQRG